MKFEKKGLRIKIRAQQCQDDWTPGGDYCYFVSKDPAAWNVGTSDF